MYTFSSKEIFEKLFENSSLKIKIKRKIIIIIITITTSITSTTSTQTHMVFLFFLKTTKTRDGCIYNKKNNNQYI